LKPTGNGPALLSSLKPLTCMVFGKLTISIQLYTGPPGSLLSFQIYPYKSGPPEAANIDELADKTVKAKSKYFFIVLIFNAKVRINMDFLFYFKNSDEKKSYVFKESRILYFG
jgi:hypothetical protein